MIRIPQRPNKASLAATTFTQIYAGKMRMVMSWPSFSTRLCCCTLSFSSPVENEVHEDLCKTRLRVFSIPRFNQRFLAFFSWDFSGFGFFLLSFPRTLAHLMQSFPGMRV
jgi:hypothetical protein